MARFFEFQDKGTIEEFTEHVCGMEELEGPLEFSFSLPPIGELQETELLNQPRDEKPKQEQKKKETSLADANKYLSLALKCKNIIADKRTCKGEALRMFVLQQYFGLMASGKPSVTASELLAVSVNRGVYYSKKIRLDAKLFEKDGEIQPTAQGKHTKIASLLVQNNFILMKQLQYYVITTPPKNRTSVAFKKYMDAFLLNMQFIGQNGERVTHISVETARLWLKKYGKPQQRHRQPEVENSDSIPDTYPSPLAPIHASSLASNQQIHASTFVEEPFTHSFCEPISYLFDGSFL